MIRCCVFWQEAQQTVHVFVDNLNTSLGAQVLPQGRDASRRLHISRFTDVVAGVRQLGDQAVVDHQTRTNHPIWWFYSLCGFELELESSLADNVMALLQDLERERASRHEHVLAVCTGDGRHVDLVRYVAECGWRVELWCWRATCHSGYQALAEDPGLRQRVRLCYLDGFRSFITMSARRDDEESLRHLPEPAESDVTEPHGGTEASAFAGTDAEMCALCLSEEASYAFRPCNHRVMCGDCFQDVRRRLQRNPELENSPQLGQCFVCRSRWTEITPV